MLLLWWRTFRLKHISLKYVYIYIYIESISRSWITHTYREELKNQSSWGDQFMIMPQEIKLQNFEWLNTTLQGRVHIKEEKGCSMRCYCSMMMLQSCCRKQSTTHHLNHPYDRGSVTAWLSKSPFGRRKSARTIRICQVVRFMSIYASSSNYRI